MRKKKLLIIGASGFVGRNLYNYLSPDFEVIATSRKNSAVLANFIYFDLTDKESYINIQNVNADIIINCAGYGVVKTEVNVDTTYAINYLCTTEFYKFLSTKLSYVQLIHIGTAFEYDLDLVHLDEQSYTFPRTHYGLSKYMASKYLLEKRSFVSFKIIRAFNMYGPYDDISKLLPSLILSQKNRQPLCLTDGTQKRDYFFVEDLAAYIRTILASVYYKGVPSVVNLGSGVSSTLKSLAQDLIIHLPYYNAALWEWGALPCRENESEEFYNKSTVATNLGLKITPFDIAIKKTIEYYWNL